MAKKITSVQQELLIRKYQVEIRISAITSAGNTLIAKHQITLSGKPGYEGHSVNNALLEFRDDVTSAPTYDEALQRIVAILPRAYYAEYKSLLMDHNAKGLRLRYETAGASGSASVSLHTSLIKR